MRRSCRCAAPSAAYVDPLRDGNLMVRRLATSRSWISYRALVTDWRHADLKAKQPFSEIEQADAKQQQNKDH